jgi:hypothetical protein
MLIQKYIWNTDISGDNVLVHIQCIYYHYLYNTGRVEAGYFLAQEVGISSFKRNLIAQT